MAKRSINNFYSVKLWFDWQTHETIKEYAGLLGTDAVGLLSKLIDAGLTQVAHELEEAISHAQQANNNNTLPDGEGSTDSPPQD